MEFIGGELSLWSDFAESQVESPDTPVVIADAEPLWAFVATRVQKRGLRILAVGPSAVAALAGVGAAGWDAVLRASSDARAAESLPGSRFVYCGSALRFETQEQYDLVLCFDSSSTVLGHEDATETDSYLERCLSWGAEVLLIVQNAGSVLNLRGFTSDKSDTASGFFFGDWETRGLKAMAVFRSRSLVSPDVHSSIPIAEGMLNLADDDVDTLNHARLLARTGQTVRQAPNWLWGTPGVMERLPAVAWVEPSPTGLCIHETFSRVLFASPCEDVQSWPEQELRVGPVVLTAPNTFLPEERLEDLWVAAVGSPSALRALVRSWNTSLQSLPTDVLPFASPDVLDQDGNFLDMGWRWNRSLTPTAARAVCLRRFARRLLASGTPHQWHALSSVDDITESLLVMCGIDVPASVGDEFEVELNQILHRGSSVEDVQDNLLRGDEVSMQLASMGPGQLRRLVGLLSGELQSERDKADAEAIRARSQDWRIAKLTDELDTYRGSIPFRVHRVLTAPKRVVKAQAKALIARVLPTNAQEKIKELIRRAQREAGQKSS